MNTLHLKYALEVARTRSISQAAENLYMGQPTLSKSIRELEESVGYGIFERTTKGVIPTERGREFLIYARNILSQQEKIERLAQEDADTLQEFTVSIPRSSYIANAFTSFASKLDPALPMRVRVQETNSVQTITNIVDGSASLGVIRFRKEYQKYFEDYLAQRQLCMESVWQLEYLLVMSARHPLAQREHILQADLDDCIRIAHGDNSVPYLDQTARRDRHERTRKTIFVYERGSQFDLLSTLPTTYMWVSPIPESWLKRFDLVQRVCEDNHVEQVDMLVYPKGYHMTELERRFTDELYHAKNEVAFEEYH